MNLTRIFHPIGQGAFYTEKHIIDDSEFNIVYDCGSTTLNKKQLNKKITSTFPKGFTIDILFISHFHSDHINGIETLKNHCKIKKVILPLTDNTSRILSKISNFNEDGNTDTFPLIDDHSLFFGKTTDIIYVKPTTENDEVNITNTLDLTGLTTGLNIESSTVIISGFNKHNWFFIPFNYEHNKRKKQFINELKLESLILSDIDSTDKIIKHKTKIRKAYNKIDGDLNENSLALFSGSEKTNQINFFQNKYEHPLIQNLHFDNLFNGCVYFGDINLNQGNTTSDIAKKLHRLFKNVGTIQVPHHGSIHNFNELILSKSNIKCTIISFGTNNTYGHPSDKVIGEILKNNGQPYFVTENQDSLIIQYDKTCR